MKKRVLSFAVALIFITCTMLMLTACGTGICESCGQQESLSTYRSKSGSNIQKLCSDCYRIAKFFGA